MSTPQTLFYGQLGTTPEDVGSSYVDTLAQSILGVGVVTALAIPFGLMIGGVLGVAWAVAITRGRAIGGIPADLIEASRMDGANDWDVFRKLAYRMGGIPALMAGPVLALTLLFLVILPIFASWDGSRVASGEASYLDRAPLFGIHARPASLMAAGDEPSSWLTRILDERLVYLGSRPGLHLLYDPSTKQALQVPDGLVVVVLTPR